MSAATAFSRHSYAPRSPGGLALVAAAHLALGWALLGQAPAPPITVPPQPLRVSLIAPAPAPSAPAEPQRPQPRNVAPPQPRPTPAVRATAQAAPAAAPASDPSPQPATPAADTPRASPAPPAPAANAPADNPPPTPPRFDAGYLDNPAPPYPGLSRRLGEEGRVLLRVFVAADGSPAQVEVHHSSGFARLDAAALETVRRWRFAPARRGEERIGAWVVVPISFSLRS